MLHLISLICSCTVIGLAPGQPMPNAPFAYGYSSMTNSGGNPTIYLRHYVVTGLRQRQLQTATVKWVDYYPFAVAAHEIGHIVDDTGSVRPTIGTEDQADCYAGRHLGRVAIQLGATPSWVRMMWKTVPASWVTKMRNACARAS